MICWEGWLLVLMVVIVIVVGLGILVFMVFFNYLLNMINGFEVIFDLFKLFFEYCLCIFEIVIYCF